MTPYHSDPWLTVYHGDARAVMAEMEPESVHCVVTSPPYWGLRDYGQPGQLGLEATPEEYVGNMVAVFREVKRVLRSDGTVFLNLGDSYASSPPGITTAERYKTSTLHGAAPGLTKDGLHRATASKVNTVVSGLKPKDLVGIPWRVAFALQADGWYLRSDIIWAKPNPMPESVTDRPTKAHEYLFLLSKSPRYYYDADAVREPHDTADRPGPRRSYPPASASSHSLDGGHIAMMGPQVGLPLNPAGRNLRSVWTIATAPYPGAHFATFPPKLVEPCIKAGTSEKGVCPECGAPWVREVERTPMVTRGTGRASQVPIGTNGHGRGVYGTMLEPPTSTTTGWRPSCTDAGHADCRGDRVCEICLRSAPVPATVLDPFAGSGTTGMVAQSLSRRAVLIDLSMDYLEQLMDRNRDMPLGLGA